MKKYIAVIEIDDDEEIIDASVSYVYRSNGTNYSTTESVELKADDEWQRTKTYEDGLNEAWEAARKIVCDDSYDGYKYEELWDIFDTYSIDTILSTCTASEAIDKINKHEGVKVGDEVIDSIGRKSVVMRVSGTVITIMEGDGTAIRQEKEGFKKTGRHFPQIEEVLKKMQEGNE